MSTVEIMLKAQGEKVVKTSLLVSSLEHQMELLKEQLFREECERKRLVALRGGGVTIRVDLQTDGRDPEVIFNAAKGFEVPEAAQFVSGSITYHGGERPTGIAHITYILGLW